MYAVSQNEGQCVPLKFNGKLLTLHLDQVITEILPPPPLLNAICPTDNTGTNNFGIFLNDSTTHWSIGCLVPALSQIILYF
jgi:hypothetical protein